MILLKRIRYLLTDTQKRKLLTLAILMIIGLLFEMAGLGILIPAMRLMIDSNITKEYPFLYPFLRSLGNPSQAQLVVWGMSFLVFFYLIKALFMIVLSWRQSHFIMELSASLSKKLFSGYLRQPYTFHLQRNSAELLRNIHGEVGYFVSVSQSVIAISIEFSAIIGVALVLILIEPIGAITVTSFLAISSIILHLATKRKLLNWGKQRQFHSGLLNQHLLQGLGGVKDVKLLGRENYFIAEFSKHNSANSKIQTKVLILGQVPRIYLELLAVTGLAGLIAMFMIQNKPLSLLLPTLGVFVAAAFRLMPSVNRIMTYVQQIRYSQPVVELLFNEFRLIRDFIDYKTTNVEATFNFEIEVKNLSFKYPNADKNALNDVSLSITNGESVGIIGSSGSGKSTLVDILLGLLTPSNGHVLVDGRDIQENLRSWQNQVGYVPQAIYLTDDTIRRNVAFGIPDDQIDDVAIARAIKASQLEGFVQSLSHKLETYVGERGVKLSGGQRQRIGIARALYHDPTVIVLDEATSALDSTTEIGVMQAVSALQGNKTLIIVAHRLSTVANCNKIYKINHGKIVGVGTPANMLTL